MLTKLVTHHGSREPPLLPLSPEAVPGSHHVAPGFEGDNIETRKNPLGSRPSVGIALSWLL